MSDTANKILYIPDTMSAWPWPRKLNPLCHEIEAESIAWTESFKPYTPESQVAHNKGRIGRLAALVYGDAPRERLRTGADLMHLLYVIDEYTDVESAAGVQEISEIILDALRNPDKPRPAGEVIIGEMTREWVSLHSTGLVRWTRPSDSNVTDSFWTRACSLTTPQAKKHFLEAMTDYIRAVGQQADDRDKLTIRDVDAYMAARRGDSAVSACFLPGEMHLSVPDEAFYHPAVKALQDASMDLVILDNDVASYNREQATGYENWNILSVVMHQFGLDLYHATEWVAQYHKEVQARFHDARTRLPSFGPVVDEVLREYVDGTLGAWPRGNDCWRFESERYFGKRGMEIQETRRVPLLAKQPMNPEMRREKVQVQLIDELEQVLFATSLEAAT